jgi:hypothetical protein
MDDIDIIKQDIIKICSELYEIEIVSYLKDRGSIFKQRNY